MKRSIIPNSCISYYKIKDETLNIDTGSKLYKLGINNGTKSLVEFLDNISKGIQTKEGYTLDEKLMEKEIQDPNIQLLLKEKLIHLGEVWEEEQNNYAANRDFVNMLNNSGKKILYIVPKEGLYRYESDESENLKIVGSENGDYILESVNKGFDLIVGIFSIFQHEFLKKLNEICLKGKVDLLPVLMINAYETAIGPYVNAETTGCYDCLITRLTMCNPFLNNKIEMLKDISYIGINSLDNKDVLHEILSEVEAQLVKNMDKLTRTDLDLKTVFRLKLGTDKQFSEHKLIPIHACIGCNGSQDKESRKKYENSTLEEFVDDWIGLVTSISIEEQVPSEPKIFTIISSSCDFSKVNPYLTRMGNSGAGFTEIDAINSAIGESLERYAAACVKKESICVKSWNEFTEDAVDPNDFELFSDNQYNAEKFPYKRFTRDTKVGWIKGMDLYTNKDIWVPAPFVYIPYLADEAEEKITPYITTGLAAGPNLESAILSGIYEVIERDSFSITWMSKLPPVRRINIEDYFKDFGKYYDNSLKYNAYEITLDIPIRTVFATMEGDDGEGNILTVGAASRLTIESALRKAILEATQGRKYIRMLLDFHRDLELKDGFNNIDNFQKHAMFYSKFPEMRKKVGFLIDEEPTVEFRDSLINSSEDTERDIVKLPLSEQVKYCVDMLNEEGYKVIAVDITPFDLRKIGVHVARVVIPKLHGLHGTHKFRFLGGSRLNEVPAKVGKKVEQINPLPHPFP